MKTPPKTFADRSLFRSHLGARRATTTLTDTATHGRYVPLAINGLTLGLSFEALGAYTLAKVPFPWIGNVLVVCLAILLAVRTRYASLAGLGFLLMLTAWGIVVTIGNCLAEDYSHLMPRLASTSYTVFIGLRFLSLLNFASYLYIIAWLINRGQKRMVVSRILMIATVVAITSLYIYVADVKGLPKPVRNRLSTSGTEQLAEYSSHFS
jgi:hypothetical protein